MTRATFGWLTFIAALLSFGGAYFLPAVRDYLVYLGVILLVVTSFLRSAARVNKWGN